MAGGVEGQQAGPFPAREGECQEALRQFPDCLLIGPHQVRREILGLDTEVGQGAGGLHQGPAHQGAPRAVHSQGPARRRWTWCTAPRGRPR